MRPTSLTVEGEIRILEFQARLTGPRWLLRALQQALPATPAWAAPAEPTAVTHFEVKVVPDT